MIEKLKDNQESWFDKINELIESVNRIESELVTTIAERDNYIAELMDECNNCEKLRNSPSNCIDCEKNKLIEPKQGNVKHIGDRIDWINSIPDSKQEKELPRCDCGDNCNSEFIPIKCDFWLGKDGSSPNNSYGYCTNPKYQQPVRVGIVTPYFNGFTRFVELGLHGGDISKCADRG